MRKGLHALAKVEDGAISMDKVFNGAKSDIGVVTDPGSLDERPNI